MSPLSINSKVTEFVLLKSHFQIQIFSPYSESTCPAQTNHRRSTLRSYLDALSSAISELPPDSPLLIVGDLNCHLGHLGGPRSTDLPNARGHLWKELIDHKSLFVPSLCQLASVPIHTYHSGPISTTVDYVLGNLALASSLTSCVISEDHPLNTSDHVPIFTCLNMNVFKLFQPSHNTIPHLCWERSVNNGSVMLYASRCDDFVRPFMNKDYSSIEQLDNDITYV